MPRIVREAVTTWEGSVARGGGTVTAASSGAFGPLPIGLPSRIGDPNGQTSPEELLAAAHAGCIVLSIGSELARVGAPPERLEIRCTITMDEIEGQGHHIVGSRIDATVVGPAVDDETFDTAITAADEGCPFSALLKRAGAEVTVNATREEAR